MNIVVVESPAKAKTINKFLGADFEVTASMGHIRDLPTRDLAAQFIRDHARDAIGHGLVGRHQAWIQAALLPAFPAQGCQQTGQLLLRSAIQGEVPLA